MELFKTRPLLVPKVWGGRKLGSVFGKSLPDDQPYGEAWEVADIAEGQSTIASGPLEGEPLRRAVEAWGTDLTGRGGDRFPLLVKLLDAAKDLSVQVHPGPGDAAVLGGKAFSKDECWLVLDAEPDGAIVHGLRDEASADSFRAAIDEGRLNELLHRFSVAAGDVFRVAPGSIHAICAGVSLLEIQQPSDTTYRVYDYNRPGLDGNPRPLHIDAALEVARLGPTLPQTRGLDQSLGLMLAGVRVHANVDAYRVEQIAPESDLSWSVSAHTPQVVHVLRGSVCLDDLLIQTAETAVIPAAQGRVWLTKPENAEIVVAGLGGGPLLAR